MSKRDQVEPEIPRDSNPLSPEQLRFTEVIAEELAKRWIAASGAKQINEKRAVIKVEQH